MTQEIITVSPTAGSKPNDVQWTLCYNGTCGGPGQYPAVEVPPNSGPHVFVISIDDPNNTGIKFAGSGNHYPMGGEDALWVVRGKGQHPQGKGIDAKNQLTDITLTNGTTLVLTNKNDNGYPFWMSYRLNFVGKDGKAVTSLDPDWKNGGGTTPGTTQYFYSDPVVAGAIAIAIAVVAFLVGAWLFRSRP